MTNLTITNNDLGSVILQDAQFRDELLTFAGADTFVEGTLLARQAVEIAVVAAADGGNTGNGVASAATVVAGSIVPLVGVYKFEIVETITEGGVGRLLDPNGAQVAGNLILDPAGEAATVFEAGGLQFTITEGSTDFALADFFTLTVAADGNLIPFAIAGAGGAQVAKAILTYDVTRTGSGDEPIRAMISGSVRKERLIIDADGDGSNITDAILDELRDFSIVSTDVQELNILDNQ